MHKKEEKKSWPIFGWLEKFFGVIKFVARGLFHLLLFFLLLGFVVSFFSSFAQIKTGNIEVIPIEGVISTGSGSGLLGEKSVVSDKIVKELKSADKNKNIKAVILEINSPGGSPVATYEITTAIKKMNKPIISVIRETGASGAFWVAVSSNRVFANPMSITASIGVLASHLEFAGLMKRYNITYRRLVAGKFKDAGSPYKEMTVDEQVLYQKVLDKLHDEFISSVAQSRKLSIDSVRAVADGFILLGSEAKDKGLVDEFGGRDEAVKYLEQKLNITADVFEYKERAGLKELLAEMFNDASFWFGQGVSSALLSKEKTSITI